MSKFCAFLIMFLLVAPNICSGLADPACLERPGKTGPCMAYFPSYTYSPKKGCYFFVYGGCKGNNNRFGSHEECVKACVSS